MRRFMPALCLCLLLLPLASLAFAPPAQIKLESTSEWGGAAPQDVQAVLDSVVNAIAPYTSQHSLGTVIVRHSTDVPRSLYEKGEHGEYIVQISASGNFWAQYAYQFSHEMCHLMSNYELAPNNASHQQWFEEAICEAFSLFTLDQMAKQWAENPPYPHWQAYAPHFSEYRQTNFDEPHRKLPTGMTLATWYQQNSPVLTADPYAQERDLDEVVANQLLLVFAAKPENWVALNYLNLGDDGADKSLQSHLRDWQRNAPPDLQAPITQVRQLLLSSPE